MKSIVIIIVGIVCITDYERHALGQEAKNEVDYVEREPFSELREWGRRKDSTIGELARRSEAILIGTIVSHGGRGTNGSLFTVRVERVLIGARTRSGDEVDIEAAPGVEIPDAGTRCLVCISKKTVMSTLYYSARPWPTVDTLPGKDASFWRLMGDERGLFTASNEQLNVIATAFEEDIAWHRARTLSVAQYSIIINGRLESNHGRLKEDAQFDLPMFFGQVYRHHAGAIEANGSIPPAIKERYLSWDERRQEAKKRIRTRSRDEVEKMFRDMGFYEAIASSDEDRICASFRLFGDLAQHEMELYKDLWVPQLLRLLESESFDLKNWAADYLARIKYPDPRVYEVLIAGLRHPSRMLFAAISLELATEQYDLPVDPDAPAEVRERQVRAWESWWEQEGRRLMQSGELDTLAPKPEP